MLAFAWLSWLVVFALFVTVLRFTIVKKAFCDPMHGGRRATHTASGEPRMRNLP